MTTDALDTHPEGTLLHTMGHRRTLRFDQESGRVLLEFEAKTSQCHSGNIVQGGFVTGWIDSAMAHAIIAKTGGTLIPLSLDIKIAFYAAAHPGIVRAEGWIERMGKRTAFVEGQLTDEEGTIIAKGMSTVRLVPAPAQNT
ncbi:MAG: PaaI family thioesterase [Parvibaculum sp.]